LYELIGSKPFFPEKSCSVKQKQSEKGEGKDNNTIRFIDFNETFNVPFQFKPMRNTEKKHYFCSFKTSSFKQ
jgi:hypothetical protein